MSTLLSDYKIQEKLEYVNCDLCNNNEAALLFTKDDYKHVKCNSCGLSYANPRLRQSKDNLDSFYASDGNPSLHNTEIWYLFYWLSCI